MSVKKRGADLYIIQSDVTGAVKVGRTQDAPERLKQLQTGCPYQLRLMAVFPGLGHRETRIHRILRSSKRPTLPPSGMLGEWFPLDVLPELPDELYGQLPLEDLDTWWVPG